MMHESSKVVSFANGTHGYKDGRGGDPWIMESLEDFKADFTALERQFRTKEDAVQLQLVAQTRVNGGCANIRFKSNFNTTRCAGEVGQHLVAIRLNKAIKQFAVDHPDRIKHSFEGDRWKELVEMCALETLAASLTFKSQHETAMTAAFWYYWLCDTFNKLAGNTKIDVIDLARVGRSTSLPTTLRDTATFTVLGLLVQARVMMEFKRRFGREGNLTGLDVDPEWRPTMQRRFALPMLMDPKINNSTSTFGLSEVERAKYLVVLHDMHYQWYLGTRDRDLAVLIALHDRKVAAQEAAAVVAAEDSAELARARAAAEAADLEDEDGLTDVEEEDDDDGCDPESDEGSESMPAVQHDYVAPPPPTLPLIEEGDFLEMSKRQHGARRQCCKSIDWKLLCVDKNGRCLEKYQVRKKGVLWRALLWDVPLGSVWENMAKVPDAA
jgi:hypothetical protein